MNKTIKHQTYFVLVFILACCPFRVVLADTMNLNSPPGELVDSYGIYLDNTFTAQLGIFDNSFAPDEFNIADWDVNWVVFASSPITPNPNPIPGGQFQLSEVINDSGISSYYDDKSGDLNASFDFSGMDAWLWVYNGTDIEAPGTEWFLARASNWTFPLSPTSECCGDGLNITWSLSDLFDETVTPEWGNQNGQEGAGVVNNFSPTSQLQTYSVVPEPSTWVMMGMMISAVGVCALMRRKGVRT